MEPLCVTTPTAVTLLVSYLRYCDQLGSTRQWCRVKERFLLTWLAGVSDVTRVTYRSVIEHLDAHPSSRKHRIETIKHFYTWMRETGQIDTSQDPTYGKLRVPRSRPEQALRVKSLSRDELQRLLLEVQGVYRHQLIVLAATGWHVTELQRFARKGRIDPGPVLICPHAKIGGPLYTRVSDAAAASANLVREHGTVNVSNLFSAVRNAAARLGFKFTVGSMRHTVATIAIEAGANLADVATFLNHKSTETTKRFYATHARPKKVPTII